MCPPPRPRPVRCDPRRRTAPDRRDSLRRTASRRRRRDVERLVARSDRERRRTRGVRGVRGTLRGRAGGPQPRHGRVQAGRHRGLSGERSGDVDPVGASRQRDRHRGGRVGHGHRRRFRHGDRLRRGRRSVRRPPNRVHLGVVRTYRGERDAVRRRRVQHHGRNVASGTQRRSVADDSLSAGIRRPDDFPVGAEGAISTGTVQRRSNRGISRSSITPRRPDPRPVASRTSSSSARWR